MRYAFAALLGIVTFGSSALAQSEALSLQPSAAALTAALYGDTGAKADFNPFDGDPGSGWTTKQFYISGAIGDSKGPIVTAHAGAGYEFIEDVTINLEAVIGVVNTAPA